MILVDSCVWIDYLKGHSTAAVRRLSEIQEKRTPELCMSSIIYFEVLRGIRTDLNRKQTQRAFDLLEKRDYRQGGFEQLIALSLQAESKGITIKHLGDWLIVKTVLDHQLQLLTSDKDFYRLARFIPLQLENSITA